MLKKILPFIFCCLYFAVYGQQKELELEVSQGTSLEELILLLEQEHGFLFSYKHEDIQGIKLAAFSEKGTIEFILKKVLKNKIKFKLIDQQYILLSKKITPELKEPVFELSGIVIDSFTQKSLLSANVYIKGTQQGSTTNADGRFQFRCSNLGANDSLIISYVGFQEVCLPVRLFVGTQYPQVLMSYYDFGSDFVVVTDYLTDGIGVGEQGKYTELRPDKIGALPGQAEPDVLTTIQFLPGISSCDGTLSGTCIQGGTPDQNLVLWEEIPVYHSAHYFGMISAFNPYIINKVSVYRGGFGAEYGGRIAGVIDMRSDMDASSENRFGLGSNFINAYTYGNLRTKDKKLSVVYSLRRSITELWRSPTFDNITQKVLQGVLVQNVDLNKLPPKISIEDEFQFVDANLKIDCQLSDKDQLSVAGFYSDNYFESLILDDKAKQRQTDTFDLSSNGINIKWNRQWRRNYSTQLTAHYTDYAYEYGYSLKKDNDPIPEKQNRKESSIEEKQIHWLNQLQLKNEHKIKLGYQFTNYDVAYKVGRKVDNNGVANTIGDFNTNIHVLYAMFNSSEAKRFGIEAGLRFNYYEQIDKQYYEPRVRLWYKLPQLLQLHLSAGRYYQYLSQLVQIEGDQASIATPVWGITGSKEVPVLNSNQFQLGALYKKNSWLLETLLYYKQVKGLTSLASGFDEGLSNKFHLGDAEIKGLDLILKKRWTNYHSWLSYTLSEVNHEFPTFFDENFPGPTDQRHSLSWVNMLSLGGFEFSLGWKISSGRTYTNKDNFEIITSMSGGGGSRESLRPLVNEFNSERLPAQHQLDASIVYNYFPKGNRRWKGTIGLSLYNIYHHRNIYSRDIYIRKGNQEAPTLEYIDRTNMGFTPNVVLRVEW